MALPTSAAAEPPTGGKLPSAVRLRDAAARDLTRAQLRGPGWRRLSHGLYAPVSEPDELAEQVRALAQVLPRESGFGHLTSAALRGWWLPNHLGAHVLLATTTSRVHVQRPGLYVRRSDLAEFESVGADNSIACVTGAQTLLELAKDLTLVDLVPMVDCALARGTDAADIEAASRRRSRGAATLRKALRLADPLSESWWESVLRLQHVLTGLGPVQCQVEIRDELARGRFVARADLHLVGTRRYPECDGGEHRSRERHVKDLRRDKALSRLGLERYGYSTAEIAYQPELVISDAESARGLVPDQRRLQTWWRLARPSSLTAVGRRRLAARLDRYRRAAPS